MKSTCTLFALVIVLSIQVKAQTWPGKIGIGLGGIGGVAMEFADVAKTMRGFDGATLDANGYPMNDFQIVVFDARPCCPWLGSVDDPTGFVPKLMAGVYKMKFNGKAVITPQAPGITIRNQTYDESSNTTSAEVVVPQGNWLVILNFSQTQRTAASAANTGITGIQVLRPGYHNRPQDTYRKEFLNAVSLFPVIRFMDFTDTNNSNPPYPQKTEWTDRVKKTDALFHDTAPWEYIVELANLTGKDIWINIPIAASNQYVAELASFLKSGLTNQSCKIYLEYSNEVWNGQFDQYTYNRAAASAEVAVETGGGATTTLNDEAGQCDRNDLQVWGARRYLRRMKEIGDTFVETFSPGSRNSFETRIRPVFAWQIGGWIPYYSCALTWFERVYGNGSVKNHFYGLSGAAYINDAGVSASASPQDILDRMRANSNAGRGSKRDSPTNWTSGSGKIGLKEIADIFQIRLLQYETGPDNGGGSAVNIANRISANRVGGIRDVLTNDLRQNWFNDPLIGGDLVMYFVLSSSYTRYGSWGATEEIENLHTPKLKALYSLAGITEDLDAPGPPRNVQVSLTGTNALVQWEAPLDNAGISHYRIYDQTGAVATVMANEPLNVTIPGVTAATVSSIKVTAIDMFNNETGQLITGVDGSSEKRFTVYPVPSDGIIRMMVNGMVAADARVRIFNSAGKNVFEQRVADARVRDDSGILLDVSSLRPGIYQMVLISGNEVSAQRIVKN